MVPEIIYTDSLSGHVALQQDMNRLIYIGLVPLLSSSSIRASHAEFTEETTILMFNMLRLLRLALQKPGDSIVTWSVYIFLVS